jgi:hypothetical protein
MARLRCPVLRLDSKQPLDALVGAVADELGRP